MHFNKTGLLLWLLVQQKVSFNKGTEGKRQEMKQRILLFKILLSRPWTVVPVDFNDAQNLEVKLVGGKKVPWKTSSESLLSISFDQWSKGNFRGRSCSGLELTQHVEPHYSCSFTSIFPVFLTTWTCRWRRNHWWINGVLILKEKVNVMQFDDIFMMKLLYL